MRSTRWLYSVIAVFTVAILALPALPAAAEQHEGEMSEEEKAMQEAWMKAMTPGEQHDWLASRTGTWKATVKMFWEPESEPQVTEGTVEREMLLGGRVLKEQFQGSFQDQPFEGIGMTGYDNVTGKFWSTWVDNMSTGLYKSEGQMTGDGQMVMKGTSADPMTGDLKKSKWVATQEENREVHEAWEEHGEEMVKVMEIIYERQ